MTPKVSEILIQQKDVGVLLCLSLTQAFAAYLEDKQRS